MKSSLVAALCLVALLPCSAFASGPYKVGSGNTVTADPLVPRPSTTPCVVQLFSDAAFYEFNNENFVYSPPANCPGPWAKVILSGDINVQPGVQYDRTANFWLGPYNIYFGTTAEPGGNLGPAWHIENDLTELSPIFQLEQTGVASIGNTLCCGLSSIIFASAKLEFYPVPKGQSAPKVADAVFPLSNGQDGGTVTLNTSSDAMAVTANFPINTVQAYLDVYSQSQSGDEFWYTCVPNDVANELFSCGGTGFRETEVFVDGQPAGVAPVSPWIFTGGIDPFLWFPIPGVQTLNFVPTRVDLTPFAGLLSNGHQHTVSVSVYNANGYFEDTANLVVYTDHAAPHVTGGITQNTLAAPSPVITENLKVGNTITGKVNVASNRSYSITGYVETSAGRVTTQVSSAIAFQNLQTFTITDTNFIQNINLTTLRSSKTSVQQGSATPVVTNETWSFPLAMKIAQIEQSNGDLDQITTSRQTYGHSVTNGASFSVVSNQSQQTDTLIFDSSFNFLGNKNQSSGQTYASGDSSGNAYACTLSAKNNALTSFSAGCPK